jgi:hypothetical protein
MNTALAHFNMKMQAKTASTASDVLRTSSGTCTTLAGSGSGASDGFNAFKSRGARRIRRYGKDLPAARETATRS